MTAPLLRLLPRPGSQASSIPLDEQLADHKAMLQAYLDTHITRNHTEVTRESDRFFLTSWFESILVPDERHPDGQRQLLLWEAMEPVIGRNRIVEYCKALVAAGMDRGTVIRYMGRLRRLFDFALARPDIPGQERQRIDVKYGVIEQPLTKYDYPVHATEPDAERIVLTTARLNGFLTFIRDQYVLRNQKVLVAWRDYTMIVLAAESGLRNNELCHLDAWGPDRDLFYREGRIQVRFGKGYHGSGPRVRQTIFTPFAQQTVRAYEEQVRPHFRNAKLHPALFLTEAGDRMTYHAAYRGLKSVLEAARKAGLDLPRDLCWHDFRRYFATNFMEHRPREVWVLMQMMGHINPSTLHRYVKPSQAYSNTVMDDFVRELTATLHIEQEV